MVLPLVPPPVEFYPIQCVYERDEGEITFLLRT